MAVNIRNKRLCKLLIAIAVSVTIILTTQSGATAAKSTSVNPSCHAESGSTLRLYWAIFNRAPDKKGSNYWLNQIDSGQSLKSISYWMFKSPEYKKKYAGLNNAQFVDKAYKNVLRRKPDTKGKNYWLKQLRKGMTRSDMIVNFSASKEFKTRHTYARNDFCTFVSKKGGGQSIAPGVVYQKRGNAHVAFVNLKAVKKTFTTREGTAYEKTEKFAKRTNMTVAINGNWFSSQGRLDGFAVSQGNTYGGNLDTTKKSPKDHNYTAIFGFTENNKVITDWHGVVRSKTDSRIVNSVSGHPTLVHKGHLASDFGFNLGPTSLDKYTLVDPNAHSAIGVSADGNKLIMVSVDRSRGNGISALDLAKLMKKLGAREAVMLDGGGSTALAIKGVDVSKSQTRDVAVNIGVRTGNYFE